MARAYASARAWRRLREACPSSFAAMKSANEAVRHRRSGPLVLRRAAGHRSSHSGSSRGAHGRLRRSSVRCCARALRRSAQAVFQGSVFAPLVRFGGRAQAHSLAVFACQERHQPSARALHASHCLSFVAEGARCSVRSAQSTLSRAGLAWQTRCHGTQRGLLHQPPNRFIERTVNGGLRSGASGLVVPPLPAAHVER